MKKKKTKEDDLSGRVFSLLHRPTAGFEIPEELRQTLLGMERDGVVKSAGLETGRYDLAIFWRQKWR